MTVSSSPLELTQAQAQRVSKLIRQWSKVARTGVLDSPCLLWQGVQRREGIGGIQIDGQTYDVHRVAYAAAKGPVPQGTLIRHLCHCSLCCNPDHLALGNSRDNNLDTIRAGNRPAPRSLSHEERIAIRSLRTVLSSRQLSRLLSRSRTTVRDEIDRYDEAEVSP